MSEVIQRNWWKIGGIAAIAILLFLSGLYIGKKHSTVIEKTITEYLPGEPIYDSIPYPVPYYVTEPVDTANLIAQCVKDGIYQELFPEKVIYLTDTTQFTKQDSTKIMIDWASKREYTETLFDIDTVGKCTIDATVQYNRIANLNYTFNPVYKQQTVYIESKREVLPFVGAGITTFPSANAEAGLFFNQSFGVAIQGNYYFNPNPKVPRSAEIPQYDVGLKFYKMF